MERLFLNAEQIKRISDGLTRYSFIMDFLCKVDISKDIEFQKTFTYFYKIRRNEDFRKKFYSYLEVNKNNYSLTIEEVLFFLYTIDNKIELSFSSKLLHTINPSLPIIDRHVLNNLSLKKRYIYKDNNEKLKDNISLYYEVINKYNNIKENKEYNLYINTFNYYINKRR